MKKYIQKIHKILNENWWGRIIWLLILIAYAFISIFVLFAGFNDLVLDHQEKVFRSDPRFSDIDKEINYDYAEYYEDEFPDADLLETLQIAEGENPNTGAELPQPPASENDYKLITYHNWSATFLVILIFLGMSFVYWILIIALYKAGIYVIRGSNG